LYSAIKSEDTEALKDTEALGRTHKLYSMWHHGTASLITSLVWPAGVADYRKLYLRYETKYYTVALCEAVSSLLHCKTVPTFETFLKPNCNERLCKIHWMYHKHTIY